MTRIALSTGLLLAAGALASGCTAVAPNSDTLVITRTNPDTMVDTKLFGYTQIVTVENGRMVYLAGQGPTKLNEKSPGPDDLRGQARNAVDNILLALESLDAGPENIVYLRINVVDYNPRMLVDIAPELARLKGENEKPPASVFVGVSSLVLPTTRIEIETVAAIP
ncbi:MAG: RidA family protein [Gammaproteobacteria bacterium]|jgi:enamine deaminase RidA (YjgF/YER057c/UK114 family)|nr:RidA family protein [Gammaproteobacteria bacterium]MDP6616979.1 RidA family protein [Gammaproteobacteria bacterium]MDP6695129.1 RidA family protein [Gammaproteobacteria bacterium]